MYRILHHGRSVSTFSRIKNSFPPDMALRMSYDRSNLRKLLESFQPNGIILSFQDTSSHDLRYLKTLMGLPGMPGIIVTARNITVSQAVCCMRHGVFDCFSGPVTGEIVGVSLRQMVEASQPGQSAAALIDGESAEARALRKRLAEYTQSDSPVLITGETGSGKELAARTIHAGSSRRDGPFIAVNCASYPDDLLSTELFGSCRGAFTGSVERPGFIEESNAGTLFLDEIGEMSLRGQAHLLRVVEDGLIRRMGSVKTRKVDVRFIAATNRNLREAVAQGSFRSDLFYRINLLSVAVPPLRKRRSDIPLLSRRYLTKTQGSRIIRIENAAMGKLVRHPWRGNVRELQSVLSRARLRINNGTIKAADIQFD